MLRSTQATIYALALLLLAFAGSGCRTTATHGKAPSVASGDDAVADDSGGTVIAQYAVKRQIAMFYTVDLKQDNRHAQTVADVVRTNEPRLRTCYTDRLDKEPDLRGQVVFAFQLSKAKGSMQNIARVGGDLDSKPVERCLKNRLAKLPFSLPRDMAGTIAYRFDATETRK